MTAPSLPRLLTASEVSARTGIPLWRIYELSRTGEMPSVRIGRSYRFSAEAVRRWIDAGGTRDSQELGS